MPGDHDDGKRLVEGVELAQHLETVHARHLDVEQHEIRPLPLNRRDAFLSCCRADELVVLVSRIIRSESRIAPSSSITRMRGFTINRS